MQKYSQFPLPATASAEGAQLNGRPFPATASAEGAQFNVPPSLWERVVSQGEGLHRDFSGEAIVQESFAAYVVKKNDDRVEGEVTTLRADQLPAGDITIAVA